ncbi:MAG TPA: hypothetical protein VFN67_37425 [Polyangiales bacterium]|nr:hypothetical protein [Polyangiales bacterium]
MTKKKRATKRKATTWRRSRAVPLQVFLAEDEDTKLCADAAANGRTKSEHVRYLISLDNPKRKRSPRKAAAQQPSTQPIDPRQTNIEEITTRPEGEALREWAEREGRSGWLQENLS